MEHAGPQLMSNLLSMLVTVIHLSAHSTLSTICEVIRLSKHSLRNYQDFTCKLPLLI